MATLKTKSVRTADHPVRTHRRNWKLLSLLAFALVVVLLAAVFAPSSERTQAVVPAEESQPKRRVEPTAPTRSTPSPSPRSHAAAASFIRRVKLEKEQACVGEPVRVSVEADDPDREDERLLYRIDGKIGNPGVATFDRPGTYTVAVEVFKRGQNPAIDRKLVQLRIDDCQEDTARLSLDHEYLAERGVHSFVAKLQVPKPRNPPAPGAQLPSARPATEVVDSEYSWDFGDGTKLVTDVPYTEHEFRARPGQAVMSTFSVRVEAVLGGRTLLGTAQITVQNLYAVNRERGVLAPEAKVQAIESSGSDRLARVRIKNPERYAMKLERVALRFVPCSGEAPPSPQRETLRPASEFLSAQWLESGDNELLVRLHGSDIPEGACIAQLSMTGAASEEQLPVAIDLAMVLRKPAPTRMLAAGSNPASAADLAQVELLDRALALLGRSKDGPVTVSEEELSQLKQQGRL